MAIANESQLPIPELLLALELAISLKEFAKAKQLQELILQRITIESVELKAIELRIRTLISSLEYAEEQSPLKLEDLIVSRGNSSEFLKDIVYPVWFATNRQSVHTTFGTDLNKNISYGRVDVHIPKAHRFGEIGSNFWTRLRRLNWSQDKLSLQNITIQQQNDFFAEIQQASLEATQSGEDAHALFFLHGYNTSFEEAAIRAAQLGCDLKVAGPTAFFSWPSRGNVISYPIDEATIEASERNITSFLIDFAINCKAEKVHVIAHSMGNRGLLRALQRIAGNVQIQTRIKFGQIFLAAPDVDRELFLDLARIYPNYSERTTLYASDNDSAVHLSSKVHGAPRAGYFKPFTVVPGIDTVTVPNFNIDLLGHGYFAQAEALLHDIYDLMRHNQAPAQRQRITSMHYEASELWQLKR